MGILGYGAIGGAVADYVISRMEGVRLRAVVDTTESDRITDLLRRVEGLHFYDRPEPLADLRLDVVLEAASPAAVREHAVSLVTSGKDLIVMSVGGLVDPGVLQQVWEAADASGRKVILPCGAIAGISAIQAAVTGGEIQEVVLRTTKAPRSLQGAPYITERGLNLGELAERELIFSGNVLQAVDGFPRNLNVGAAVALAGPGPERTQVQIYADPAATRTTHELTVRGDFGQMHISLAHRPNPENPRSSMMAGFSALSTLKKYCQPVVMGY